MFPYQGAQNIPAIRRFLDDALALAAMVVRAHRIDEWPNGKDSGPKLFVDVHATRGDVPIRGDLANDAGWQKAISNVEALSRLLVMIWHGADRETHSTKQALILIKYQVSTLEGTMALIDLRIDRDLVDDVLLPSVQSGLKATFHATAARLPVPAGSIGVATAMDPEMDEVFAYAAEGAWDMAGTVAGCHWGTYLTEAHRQALGDAWQSRIQDTDATIEPVADANGPLFVQATASLANGRPGTALCGLLDPFRLTWADEGSRSFYRPSGSSPVDPLQYVESEPPAVRADWHRPSHAEVVFIADVNDERTLDPAFIDLHFHRPIDEDQLAAIVDVLSTVVDWVHRDGRVSFVSAPNLSVDRTGMELWMDAGSLGPTAFDAVVNQLAFEIEGIVGLIRLSIGAGLD